MSLLHIQQASQASFKLAHQYASSCRMSQVTPAELSLWGVTSVLNNLNPSTLQETDTFDTTCQQFLSFLIKDPSLFEERKTALESVVSSFQNQAQLKLQAIIQNNSSMQHYQSNLERLDGVLEQAEILTSNLVAFQQKAEANQNVLFDQSSNKAEADLTMSKDKLKSSRTEEPIPLPQSPPPPGALLW